MREHFINLFQDIQDAVAIDNPRRTTSPQSDAVVPSFSPRRLPRKSHCLRFSCNRMQTEFAGVQLRGLENISERHVDSATPPSGASQRLCRGGAPMCAAVCRAVGVDQTMCCQIGARHHQHVHTHANTHIHAASSGAFSRV